MCILHLLFLVCDTLHGGIRLSCACFLFRSITNESTFFRFAPVYISVSFTPVVGGKKEREEKHFSARAEPEQDASEPEVDAQVHAQAPRHAVQVLWREDGPDEEVGAQHGAGGHDGRGARGREDGQRAGVAQEDARLAAAAPGPAHEQRVGREGPVDGRGPVADKGQEADGGDAEARDAVVGAAEVDRGDGVCAAGGEEGGVLEQEHRGRERRQGEVLRREELVDDVGDEEEGHVGGAGLGQGQEGVEVVEGLGGCGG
ncbi:uncharacterized protein E0L32_012328 [Thyridium curvatum]|uniref:Uncharacterized protein n=1 Tax=Thyridium curvatum TaxID=1093900 RepID=A0A507BJZ1_9PEZI|nr:uncharacterized protein E0L32_012328 [Thyridium curvatum]TPX17018.1 hypothetical protein E0L32_012328 [Thyridium curvatum]